MSTYRIKPMPYENVFFFKFVLPREISEVNYYEYRTNLDKYCSLITKEIDLENPLWVNQKIENVNDAFILVMFKLFQIAYPRPFEAYNKYLKRIQTFDMKKVIENDKELKKIRDNENNDQQLIKEKYALEFGLKPYSYEEFFELKQKYPMLHETESEYENRVLSYGLNTITNSYNFAVFKIAHPKIDEDYKLYKKRINDLIHPEEYDEDLGIFEDMKNSWHIEVMNRNSFNAFKFNWPNAFEEQYSEYLENGYGFEEHEFHDLIKLYPRYYDTYEEFNKRMDDWGLLPVTNECFNSFKKTFPRFTEMNYMLYSKRVESDMKQPMIENEEDEEDEEDEEENPLPLQQDESNRELGDIEQDIKTLRLQTYVMGSSKKKMNNMEGSIAFLGHKTLPTLSVIKEKKEDLSPKKPAKLNRFPKMTEKQFDKFKSQIPKAFEGIAAYSLRLTNNPIPSAKLQEEYHLYVRMYPALSQNYDEYENFVTNSLRLMPITVDDFKIFKIHLPERDDVIYITYFRRLKDYEPQLKNTLTQLSLSVIKASNFNQFKSKFPMPYERYDNYKERMKLKHIDYFIELEFYDIVNLCSLQHETYAEHKQRLIKTFRQPLSFNEFTKQKSTRVLLGESFSEHKLKLETNIYSRSSNETDEKYFSRMKNDGVETIIETNFIDHMKLFPVSYETYEMFYSRNKDAWGTYVLNENWFKKMRVVLPKMCEKFDDYNTRIKGYCFPPMTEVQFKRFKYELPAPGESKDDFSKRQKRFGLNSYAKNIATLLIQISPKIIDGYLEYEDRIKKKKKEPLTLEEFNCFKDYFPKIDETLDNFNNKIKLLGFEELTFNTFSRLKFFYPRIHHFLYDYYILDIGQVNIYSESVMEVLDSQQLTETEFNEYRKMLPKQFDILYSKYMKRIAESGCKTMMSLNGFNAQKIADFPLAGEDYDQHQKKLIFLGLKSIPKDVFNFLKGIYPIIFEQSYTYRTNYETVKRLQLHVKTKYIHGNLPIVNEVLRRSRPYNEFDVKVKYLCNQIMTDNEVKDFMNSLPKVLEPYSQYLNKLPSKDSFNIMSETEYYSLKKAYFPQLHETHKEYTDRMEMLGLGFLKHDFFYHCKKIFPHPYENYEDYESKVSESEIISFVNQLPYKKTDLIKLGYKLLSPKEFSVFKNDIPKLYFTSYEDHNKNKESLSGEEVSTTNIFSEEEFEILKLAYFPKLTENYEQHENRMISSAVKKQTKEDYLYFKEIFPNLFEKSFKDYQTRLDKYEGLFPSVTIKMSALDENKFYQFCKNSPRLLENYNAYLKKVEEAGKGSDSTKDKFLFSKEFFHELKKVYIPSLGITLQNYILFLRNINVLDHKSTIELYFKNIISLYPLLFENYKKYCKRNSQSKLKELIMNEKEYKLFLNIFPRPYESYGMYTIRLIEDITLSEDLEIKFSEYGDIKEFILNNEEFDYWRQIYPQLMENYIQYQARMTKLLTTPVSLEIFTYFKRLYPQIDEMHTNYTQRVNEQYLSEDKTLDENIEFLRNITEIKVMTIPEYRSFKRSLPIPNESYEQYKQRLEKLVGENPKMHDKPHPLPLKLFDDILETYPKANYEHLHNSALKHVELAVMEKETINTFKTFNKISSKSVLEPSSEDDQTSLEDLFDTIRTVDIKKLDTDMPTWSAPFVSF